MYAHLSHVFGHSFVPFRQLPGRSVFFNGGYVGFVFVQFLLESFAWHRLDTYVRAGAGNRRLQILDVHDFPVQRHW